MLVEFSATDLSLQQNMWTGHNDRGTAKPILKGCACTSFLGGNLCANTNSGLFAKS